MRVGAIAGSLRAFTAERAPVGVVAALALALCAGPWALARGDALALLRAAAVVFLVLLALRIADDLRSLEHDRLANPARGLPSGRIAVTPLAAGAALLFAAAAAVSAPRLTFGLAGLAVYYAAYLALSARIPAVLRPPLVNAVFLAIPPGVGLLARAAAEPGGAVSGGGAGQTALLPLAVFWWLSAVGHDYAHEVHSLEEARPGPPTVSETIGPRAAALVGLGCYAGAGAAALLTARAAQATGGWPPLFLAGVAALFGYVAVLLVRLIARPGRERARRLYVTGVACFAVPSLLLGFDCLLRW